MKNVVTLAFNDLRLLLRDRTALVWLVVMPLIFTLVFGRVRYESNAAPSNARPGVLIENADTGFLGAVFLDELGAQGLNVVPPEQKADAKRGVRIPADFSETLLAGKRANVEFFQVEGSDEASTAIIQLRVLRALVAMDADLLATTHGGVPLTEEALAAVRQRPKPVSLDASFAGRRRVPTGFELSLPAMLVMYLTLNMLIFGGTRVAHEREIGVLRRMTIHPVRPIELVLGKILGLVLLSSVPIVVLLLVGQFFLGVDIASEAPGIVLTLLLMAWVAASLGVLIGYVVKAHEKIIGLCLLVALPASAMGGCWWPLEIVPPWAQLAGHFVPTAWAMDALHQFITFGAGFHGAALAMGVLALFGLGANLTAMKFFRA